MGAMKKFLVEFTECVFPDSDDDQEQLFADFCDGKGLAGEHDIVTTETLTLAQYREKYKETKVPPTLTLEGMKNIMREVVTKDDLYDKKQIAVESYANGFILAGME